MEKRKEKVQSNLWHMYGIFSRGTNAIQNYYLQSKTGYIQKSRIMCQSRGSQRISACGGEDIDRGLVPHEAISV